MNFSLFSTIALILSFFIPRADICERPNTTAPGTFFMSGDVGNSWQDLTPTLPPGVKPISFFAENGNYFLGTSTGLYHQYNWPLNKLWQKASYPDQDITGILQGKEGPFAISHWFGFYQFQPMAGMWVPRHDNLREKMIHHVFEFKSGHLFVCGESGIYKTADNGVSWNRVFEKGAAWKLVASDKVLLACTSSGIWRSADEGNNWERTFNGINKPFSLQQIPAGFLAIANGPQFPGSETPNEVFVSMDDGLSWKTFSYTLPSSLHSINYLESIGDLYVASSKEGIFRSKDNGMTWRQILSKPVQPGGFYKLIVSEGMLYVLVLEGC